MEKFSKVTVVGLGYIGLPTASMVANAGSKVLGVDVNANVVEIVNSGGIHIVEPGLEDLVNKVVGNGHLRASLSYEDSDIYVIAVPTPITPEKNADVSYIFDAAEKFSQNLKKGDLVILESTSPVGTTRKLLEFVKTKRPELNFTGDSMDVNFAYCPERVLPGKIIEELENNNRIIGGMTAECSKKAEAFYKTFVKGQLVKTNVQTAEMVKLSENSFRDVQIAFANELSLICEKLDINVWELIKLSNLHPRVNILNPGAGVGGHCIAVDPWFVVESAPEEAQLIRKAREVNISKPLEVIRQVQELISLNPDKKVACFGAAFKPDIDDLRESPALEIIDKLSSSTSLLVVEPHIESFKAPLSEKVSLVSAEKALKEADIVVFLVAHSQFKTINSNKLSTKIVKDFVNVTDLANLPSQTSIAAPFENFKKKITANPNTQILN